MSRVLSDTGTELMNLRLYGGQMKIIRKGDTLLTVKEVADECDLHYFRKNPRHIPEGEKIIIEDVWSNLYGRFVRTLIEGAYFDIKPENLKWIAP